MIKHVIVILCVVLACSQTTFAQTNDFSIYIYPNQHSQLYKAKYNYKYCQFIGQVNIDPDNSQQNDYEKIKAKLLSYYPNRSDAGFLTIDLENKSYNDVLSLFADKGSKERAVAQFTDLINYIRTFRPNVKLGVYGLPPRVLNNRLVSKNLNADILTILSKCDFISPSLYILKPAKETGIANNDAYMDANLNLVFRYSEKLNKPVIPYIWSYVYPTNKLYGKNVIDADEMVHYIKHIKDYRYGARRVAGVIWWEPSDPFYKTTGAKWQKANHMQIEHLRDSVLYQYMKKM